MKDLDKLLSRTKTYVIPKGTEVIVSPFDDVEFEDFRAITPKSLKVSSDDWFRITECDCCGEVNFHYLDDVGRINTAALTDVEKISRNKRMKREELA